MTYLNNKKTNQTKLINALIIINYFDYGNNGKPFVSISIHGIEDDFGHNKEFEFPITQEIMNTEWSCRNAEAKHFLKNTIEKLINVNIELN